MAHPKTEKSEWITKEEAAAILGVNVRQVQKRAEQGYIEKRLLPRLPNERQARVVYARRDADAIAAGTPNQHGEQLAPVERDAPKKIDTGLQKAFAQYTRAGLPALTAEGAFAFPLLPENREKLIAEADKLRAETARLKAAPRTWWPLFLTVDQAIEYSGATVGMLVKAIRDGSVFALGKGRASYRISRASLDEYGKAGA